MFDEDSFSFILAIPAACIAAVMWLLVIFQPDTIGLIQELLSPFDKVREVTVPAPQQAFSFPWWGWVVLAVAIVVGVLVGLFYFKKHQKEGRAELARQAEAKANKRQADNEQRVIGWQGLTEVAERRTMGQEELQNLVDSRNAYASNEIEQIKVRLRDPVIQSDSKRAVRRRQALEAELARLRWLPVEAWLLHEQAGDEELIRQSQLLAAQYGIQPNALLATTKGAPPLKVLGSRLLSLFGR